MELGCATDEELDAHVMAVLMNGLEIRPGYSVGDRMERPGAVFLSQVDPHVRISRDAWGRQTGWWRMRGRDGTWGPFIR